MAYIEAHQSLLTHRKTLRLGRLLGMDRFCVVGRLLSLWWWALDNAQEGYVAVSDADILADVMGWSGEVSALCNALVNSGFMELVKVNGSGGQEDTYLIHDWYDYAGNLIEKRKANAERMRRARAASHRVGEDARAVNLQRTCDERAGATVPNRTVPYPTVEETADRDGEPQDIRRDSSGADALPPAADAGGDDGQQIQAQLAPTATPKLKTVFGEESDAMQLAREFARGLREVKPDVKLPRDGLQGWAREFDLLLRVDHRPREKIEAVMRYARRSSFWRSVILSARSLREKFDRLDLQREEDTNDGTVRGSGRRNETQASGGSGRGGLGTALGTGFPSGVACGAGPRSGSPRRDGRGVGRAARPGTINGFEVGTPEYYEDARRRAQERAASGY